MHKSIALALFMLVAPAALATPDECSGQVSGFISGLEMGGNVARAKQIEAQRVAASDCVVRSSIPEIRESDRAVEAASAAARQARPLSSSPSPGTK